MAKQLLIENFISDHRLYKEIPIAVNESTELVEDNGEKRNVRILKRIKGPMGILEEKTGNGRNYREKEFLRAVQSLKPKMESKAVFGQIDHPEKTPSYRDVSHFVRDLWVESDGKRKYVYGIWDLIDTPNGHILNNIYEAGGGVGSSYRGYGNVLENGDVSDYDLVSVDAVVDPSASTFISEGSTSVKESNEVVGTSKVCGNSKRMQEQIDILVKMYESIKTDIIKTKLSEAKKLNENKELTKENIMKIKAKKDFTIAEKYIIKAGETVDLAESMIPEDKESYEKVVEEDLKSVVESKDKLISEKTEELKKATEYITILEKSGEEISAALQKKHADVLDWSHKVEDMKATIDKLTGLVDGDIANFLKSFMSSLDIVDAEVKKYLSSQTEKMESLEATNKKMVETIDNEIAPELRNRVAENEKLQKIIDETLTPELKKLSEELETLKGKKITNENKQLVEKFIQTYPQLECLREELLAVAIDNNKLEERLQKYLTLFAGGNKTAQSMLNNYFKKSTLIREASQKETSNDVNETMNRKLPGKTWD